MASAVPAPAGPQPALVLPMGAEAGPAGGSDLWLGVKAFFPTRRAASPAREPGAGGGAASAIVGRFQRLKRIHHLHLCQYIDCVRGRHERLFVVSEHHPCSLHLHLARRGPLAEPAARQLGFEVLLALACLGRHALVHHNLSSDNVLVAHGGRATLADWGVHHMTAGGADVPFALGCAPYLAPELLARLAAPRARPRPPDADPAADVWSLGVLLLEALTGARPWSSPGGAWQQVLELCGAEGRLDAWLRGLPALGAASPDLLALLRLCLAPRPADRPAPAMLLAHPYFASLAAAAPPSVLPRWERKPVLRCRHLDEPRPAAAALPQLTTQPAPPGGEERGADPLAGKPLADLYHFWKIAGGELERELAALLPLPPPVLRMPARAVALESRPDSPAALAPAPARDRARLYDERIVAVSLTALRRRLQPPASASSVSHSPSASSSPAAPATDLRPVASAPQSPAPPHPAGAGTGAAPAEAVLPPLAAREKDVVYQGARVRRFRELLAGLPATEEALVAEARVDVPPVLRGQVWAALLGCWDGAAAGAEYAALDKESEGPADRQIELDIPRCHQYNELLASPDGRRKLQRVLKAWVQAQAGRLVYWQGLDSLLAPLLVLHFADEARTYACLRRLVDKYTADFFRPDNSPSMQQRLLLFRQLVAYHDPPLAVHLAAVGFSPDLYAIPWFLTLFAHVMPLDRLYLLWDALLLGAPTLPIFVALAILHELRATILPLDFNGCIVFFSHLPELDVPEVVRSARAYADRTPPSLLVARAAPASAAPSGARSAPAPAFEELAAELAPHISAADAVRLTLGPEAPGALLDLRRPRDFEAGHAAGALPLNHKDPSLGQLEPHRGRPIVVAAGPASSRQAAELASALVRALFPEVSVLHGGVDALRAEPGVTFVQAGAGR